MAKKKGATRVVIYSAWCKGCGVCAAFCPGKVIEMSPMGKAVIAHEEECMNCGFCEMHCPDFAISVTQKDERAAAFARDVRALNFKVEPDDEAEGHVVRHENGDSNGSASHGDAADKQTEQGGAGA